MTDEDGNNFDSDRRFSNFILFAGILSLGALLMASNVQQMKRQRDREANEKQQLATSTTYTGKADIGGPWMLYDTKGQPFTH